MSNDINKIINVFKDYLENNMNSQIIDRKEAKKDKQREFNSKTKSLKKERRDNRERKYDSASEESMYYEMLKHTGEFPIIGVNTFLNSKGSPTIIPSEVIRATQEEKEYQIMFREEQKIFRSVKKILI